MRSTLPSRPHATCQTCGGTFTLSAAGAIHRHGRYERCSGSGRLPLEVAHDVLDAEIVALAAHERAMRETAVALRAGERCSVELREGSTVPRFTPADFGSIGHRRVTLPDGAVVFTWEDLLQHERRRVDRRAAGARKARQVMEWCRERWPCVTSAPLASVGLQLAAAG
jgi:hypothetical protein